MKQRINIKELSLLMNENSLSESSKIEISKKINAILNFINSLADNKNIDYSLISELKDELLKEQKITAKMIVKKNNALSKDLIKSLTIQKENSLQVIEINQLRLEAELKKLKEATCPAIQTENSLFSKIFRIFKFTFNSKSKKISNTLKSEIESTSNKLNDLEKQKEDLSNKFGTNGKEALRYLNKVTYNSFLPVSDISKNNITNIKNRMNLFK